MRNNAKRRERSDCMERCIFRSDCGDHSSCHLFALNYSAGRTREVPAASEVFLAGRSGRPAFRAALSKILGEGPGQPENKLITTCLQRAAWAGGRGSLSERSHGQTISALLTLPYPRRLQYQKLPSTSNTTFGFRRDSLQRHLISLSGFQASSLPQSLVPKNQ